MKNWSLSRKLIVSTNILVAIALTSVGLIISSKMSTRFKDSMIKQIETLAEVNAAVAAPLVWNLDSTNIAAMAERVAGKNPVIAVILLNDKQESILKDGPKPEDYPDQPFIEREMKNEGQTIGTLRMYYSEAEILESRRQALTLTFVFVILGQLLVTFGLSALVNKVNFNIAEIVQKLRHSSNQSNQNSKDLSAASDSMAAGSQTQASAIQQTTATLEEMRALGQTSATHAQSSYDRAADSYNMTVSARKKMTEMQNYVSDMGQASEDTQNQMHKTNENMADIVKAIAEIKAKTNVINDIVFQTKLLSFNASVEAARAGEHGKGFAVVAEEVGALASMSGNASKEIAHLLDGSLSRVTVLANETKQKADLIAGQNSTLMAKTEQTAAELNVVFDQIVDNNEQVKTMMNEVSTSIKEYAAGVKNIADAMTSLDQMVQEGAQAASNVSKNASSMHNESEELTAVVKSLESEFFGSSGSSMANIKTTNDKRFSRLKSWFQFPSLFKFRKKENLKSESSKMAGSHPPILASKTKLDGPNRGLTKNKASSQKAPSVFADKTKPQETKITTNTAGTKNIQDQMTNSPSKIVKMTSPKSMPKPSQQKLKQAAGGEHSASQETTDGLSVPSKSDPRFEDL